MEICGPPSPPLRAAWTSLLKSETARMLPISVVHGQIDDERHLTCYFGMLFPTVCWPTWRPSRSVVRRSSELSMARRRTGPTLVHETTTFVGPRERHWRCPEKVHGPS